jgi:hypothetical protein
MENGVVEDSKAPEEDVCASGDSPTCGDSRVRDSTEVPGRRLIVGAVEAKCPLASHSTANHFTGANTRRVRTVEQR